MRRSIYGVDSGAKPGNPAQGYVIDKRIWPDDWPFKENYPEGAPDKGESGPD